MSNFPPAPLAVLRGAELPPAEAGRGNKAVGSAGKAAVATAANEEDSLCFCRKGFSKLRLGAVAEFGTKGLDNVNPEPTPMLGANGSKLETKGLDVVAAVSTPKLAEPGKIKRRADCASAFGTADDDAAGMAKPFLLSSNLKDKERGAAGGESAGEAAATAAADEDDTVTEGKETGAAGGESAGEAAATAAADAQDEDDITVTEGKETGAAGGESAGEAAVTATRDEEEWAGKGAAAPPASVVHGAAGAASVEVEAPTQTADASNCTDSTVAEAGTAEAAASISNRI